MKNVSSLSLLILGSVLLPLSAEEPNSLPPEMKYSREQMVEMLAAQEAMVEKISDEFFSLNEQIEDQVKAVVEGVASLEDSAESGTRISLLKKKVLSDLQASLRQLQQQRNQQAAQIARLTAYRQDASVEGRAMAFLDEKLKQRVEQTMTLANSLHEHQDLRKYTYTFDTDYYGDNDVRVKRRKSDEWKDNRQQTINADASRKELIGKIEQAEKRLNNEINHIEAERVRANLAELPEAQAMQVAQKKELLEILKEKKMEIVEGKSVETTSVGSLQQAMEVERQVSLAVEQLRVTNNQLRQKGLELKAELQRLEAQQQVLARKDAAGGATP